MENNTQKYDGWLVSNSLVKRSLAVFGHYIIGSLIIFVPIYILIIIFFVIIGNYK